MLKLKVMKIAKALKEKNRLAKELNKLNLRLTKNVSHKKDIEPDYKFNDLLVEIGEKTNELIELKTKIQRANSPVYDKIFKLGELKNQVKILKELKILKGQEPDRWGSTSAIEYQSQTTQKEVDSLIEKIEGEIEKIQDELDYFNATTEI